MKRILLLAALIMIRISVSTFAWRARIVDEYQNLPLIQSAEAETLVDTSRAIQDDTVASGGKAVTLAVGGATLKVDADVKPGTYAVWLYARVPDANVDGPWQPVYMSFTAQAPSGKTVASTTRVPYQPTYQAVTHLYFIAHERGTYHLSLSVAANSEVALLVDHIEIRDPLGHCVSEAVKTGRTYLDDETLARVRATAPALQIPIAHILKPKAAVDDMVHYAEEVWSTLPAINAILGKEEMAAIQQLVGTLNQRATEYEKYADPVSAREAAIILAALAERYPTFDLRVQSEAGNFGRTSYTRFSQLMGHPYNLTRAYDRIFAAIRDDRDLAAAIGSRIPSVTSPKELRALLDRNVMQFELSLCFNFTRAGNVMGWESRTINNLLAFGPNPIAQKWMDRFLFELSYAEMTGKGGHLDYLVNGVQRDGNTYYGATTYIWGGPINLARNSMRLKRFVDLGGQVPAEAYDPKVNPRLRQAGLFMLNFRTAGGFQPIFGDGGGAVDLRFDGMPGQVDKGAGDAYAWYFQHTGDPRFAWMAKATGRHITLSDAEWAAVEAAAATTRNPVLFAQSACLGGFGCTITELGEEEKDPQMKTAAVLNFGTGRGHRHGDLLDLTLNAFHKRIITDGGRAGWPSPRFTCQHNTIEVDRHSFQSTTLNSGAFGYPLLLAESGRARFSSGGGRSTIHPNLKDYRRDVVLVDLGIQGEGENRIRRSYVVDVNRVEGGNVHTYCTHAMPADISFNVPDKPAESDPLGLLYETADPRTGMTADPLVTTWRATARKAKGQSPEYGLRHHLFGWGGLRFYSGKGTHKHYNNNIPFLWIERAADQPLADTYYSVFEPYWETNSLESVTPLTITGGGKGSHAARAVRVTSRWGRNDIVIVSETGQSVSVEGGIETDAHMALIAEDATGLVQASMVGGTYLRRKGLSLKASLPAYEGRIASMDPERGSFTIDPPLPAAKLNGELVIFGRKPHIMGEVVDVDEKGRLHLRKPCELFRSPIASVDENSGSVVPEIPMPLTAGSPDAYVGSTAFNEARDKSWRVERTEVTEMWIPVLVPISEEDIEDADGDGRKTVSLTGFAPPEKTRDPVMLFYDTFKKPVRMEQYNRPPFKEPVVLEVTRVDAEKRRLYFKPPAEYDLVWNGWAYEGVTISNESATRQWRGSYPGLEFRIVLAGDQPLKDKDFADAASPAGMPADGVRRIHLYDFGPGDPCQVESRMAVMRGEDGVYSLERNVDGSGSVNGTTVR